MKSTVIIIFVIMINYCWLFYIFIYCETATIHDTLRWVQQIYEWKSIQVDHGITTEGWWGKGYAMLYIISKKYMFLVF
jgi:sensor domain CHASE-containing protein